MTHDASARASPMDVDGGHGAEAVRRAGAGRGRVGRRTRTSNQALAVGLGGALGVSSVRTYRTGFTGLAGVVLRLRVSKARLVVTGRGSALPQHHSLSSTLIVVVRRQLIESGLDAGSPERSHGASEGFEPPPF